MYALTYIFGTIGVIVFCSYVAPRLMGISLKEEANKLEAELAGGAIQVPEYALSYRRFDSRAYRVERAAGRTVADVEAAIGEHAVIQRVGRDSVLLEPTAELTLRVGDHCSPRRSSRR